MTQQFITAKISGCAQWRNWWGAGVRAARLGRL